MAHLDGTYKKVCDKHDPEYYAKFKKVGGFAEYISPLNPSITALHRNLNPILIPSVLFPHGVCSP